MPKRSAHDDAIAKLTATVAELSARIGELSALLEKERESSRAREAELTAFVALNSAMCPTNPTSAASILSSRQREIECRRLRRLSGASVLRATDQARLGLAGLAGGDVAHTEHARGQHTLLVGLFASLAGRAR